jgi:hypothetical protein
MQVKVISKTQLKSMLAARIGLKKAKRAVYQKSFKRQWIKDDLDLVIGNSRKLQDIRLLHYFNCKLNPYQSVILLNNNLKFVVSL